VKAGVRRLHGLPHPPLAAVIVLLIPLIVLGVFVTVDPSFGVTFSGSPFQDEGWTAVNARNFALLGSFSTDQWNLYLVSLPYNLILGALFTIFGVGIVPARFLSIGAIALTGAVLAWGLRRPFGAAPAALAGLAFVFAPLALFYGRLAYFEPLEGLFLVLGVLTILRADSRRAIAWGIVGGALLALAAGTKPSALFSIGGLWLAVGILEGWRDRGIRRWLAGVALTVGAAGAAWALLVWARQPSTIDLVFQIWPPFGWPADPRELVHRVVAYLGRSGDWALLWSATLVVPAILGTIVTIRTWQADATRRRLVIAAGGAALGLLVVLAIASYRPNRYIVPILPELAMLGAPFTRALLAWLATRGPRTVARAAPAILTVAVVAPGLLAHASWVAGSPATLPSIQARMAAAIPHDAIVAGGPVALFLMQAPVTTIITRPGNPVNAGDLYVTRGVRWYVTNKGQDAQPIASDHPGVWAQRREVACDRWGHATICLYQVP
jgi:4-amino-4-deoxy-L-arabinose transferase-like glycosyltransferase